MKAVQQAPVLDVFVVGGGINGVGVAVDAAGRGLRVGLCEMGDLAGATSSSSSKLIHGGLRYLEQYEFRLVREALAEREVLLNMAPHITFPMRFFLPHRPQLRPAWMIKAGLFLYDHLSTRTTLPRSESVRLNGQSPLKSSFKQGFEYSDAWVDDARLVVLNAMALKERGGTVLTRTRAVSAVRDGGIWRIHLKDQLNGEERVVQARSLVNAAGPWVTEFIHGRLKKQSSHNVRLIKGSHIIVPALYNESRAYILQNDDQRIVFVIPYLEQFSLIGTTDVEYTGDPSFAQCTEEEKSYLCRVVNLHFKKNISVEDIVWDYSGVRPLCEDESSDPKAVTRDYTFEIEDDQGKAPLLSIFGGKLTTYRKLAEHAINRLARYFPEAGDAWTRDNRLPGAEIPARCIQQLKSRYPWLPVALADRYCHSYGSLSYRILSNADSIEGLGHCFGAGLYQAEVDYLLRHEWVMEEEDLLWRRTKLGLFLTEPEKKALGGYIKQQLA